MLTYVIGAQIDPKHNGRNTTSIRFDAFTGLLGMMKARFILSAAQQSSSVDNSHHFLAIELSMTDGTSPCNCLRSAQVFQTSTTVFSPSPFALLALEITVMTVPTSCSTAKMALNL